MTKKIIILFTLLIVVIIGGFYRYNSRIKNLSKNDNGKNFVKNISEKNQIDLTYKKYYKNLPKLVQKKIDEILSQNKEVTLICIWQFNSGTLKNFNKTYKKIIEINFGISKISLTMVKLVNNY